MKYQIIISITLALKLISCSDYNIKNYPQQISFLDGFPNVNCKYELAIDSFNDIPKRIQNLTKQYVVKMIGDTLFDKCKFNYGLISSNKVIIIKKINQSKAAQFLQNNFQKNEYFIDSINFDNYKYPVYSIGFQFYLPEKGIEMYDLNLIMDNEGSILKEIDFPEVNIATYNFIAIDSVHKILKQKKIPSNKLELNLQFDKNQKKMYYYASTKINNGSILGPSCFPFYKYHFKVDAISGQYTAYNVKDDKDFFPF